jgi:hypothetical protein
MSEKDAFTEGQRNAIADEFRSQYRAAIMPQKAVRSSDEQIEAISGKPKVKPRYFTIEQLAEAYRREGLRNPRDK